MPLKHKIILGPLQKYVMYSKSKPCLNPTDRFPWKLLITIILIMLTTMQVMLIIEYTGVYLRAVEGVWYKTFLYEDVILTL